MYIALFILISLSEILIFFLLVRFFNRLRKSEELLTRLSDGQETLLEKLHTNAALEQELMQSFAARQRELVDLDGKLEDKVAQLNTLLEQAEAISRSPQFLRELITTGRKKGKTPQQLAKSTGLSLDEISLILTQSGLSE